MRKQLTANYVAYLFPIIGSQGVQCEIRFFTLNGPQQWAIKTISYLIGGSCHNVNHMEEARMLPEDSNEKVPRRLVTGTLE